MASLHQHDEYKRRVSGGAGAADVPERPTPRYVLSPLPGRPTVERAAGYEEHTSSKAGSGRVPLSGHTDALQADLIPAGGVIGSIREGPSRQSKTAAPAFDPFADFVEALDELERTVNRHLSLRLVLLLAVSVLLVLLLVTR